MDFEEFKKRYMKKMVETGYKFDEKDAEFHDRMAEMYLALMVYSEFQNEHAMKAMREIKRGDAQ